MKKIIAVILCAALLTTVVFAFGDGTGAAVFTNETIFAEGFTYSNDISLNSSGKTVETFTLTDTPDNGVYPIVLANDTIYGGFTITQIIAYAQSLGYNVVGAVNADFGYWSTRIPCGMVVEDGVYKSSPEGNNVIAFSDDGAYVSYWPKINISMLNTRSEQTVATSHLNKTREKYGLYLYSEHFSTVSTRTSGEGRFVRLKVLEGGLTLGGEMKLEVTEIITDETAVSIGAGNLILTADESDAPCAELDGFEVGDTVTLTVSCSDEQLAGADWISGCGNILVRDGEIFDPDYWDSSIAGANPRTAIGIKPDGSVVYYVMDGRTSTSAGSTLQQLAADMMSMGCETVVNMDGGGSTALSLRVPGGSGLSVVNKPSDGSLRAVCSYILFVTDEPTGGSAARLFLGEDGRFVLAGSSIHLGYAATDAGMHTTAAENVTATAGSGTIADDVYTAPDFAVNDTITLKNETASGFGTIHVLSAPDSVTVSDADSGKELSSLSLSRGDSVKLAASALSLGRTVTADKEAFEFSVTGDVGEIDENGVFTASGAPGTSGSITVTLAGVKREISVAIAFEFSDAADHWASDYIMKLYDKGVVSGVTATTFEPDTAMRRCDFLLMLYRAAGSPAYEGESVFEDVAGDAYYAKAVNWAASLGIAQGSGTKFMPTDTLTREQGFTFLYRAFSVLGVSYTDGDPASLGSFADIADVSDWASVPTATLHSMGIIEGSGTTLMPRSELTRAQMAKILCIAAFK